MVLCQSHLADGTGLQHRSTERDFRYGIVLSDQCDPRRGLNIGCRQCKRILLHPHHVFLGFDRTWQLLTGHRPTFDLWLDVTDWLDGDLSRCRTWNLDDSVWRRNLAESSRLDFL
uniref:Uncharacterized protein n=1 Tax=uncultured marine group II/III euryarchaeote AD1000_88_D12 TaxID=1457821 RepID=A0A075FYN1_9EURY|nr:hypothetical protein [uncultured marine group II/III euryarchaeote AD1000_88_D12]